MIYSSLFVEEDEKVYWEKINADRMTRYNAKRGKKRGTEKVQAYTLSILVPIALFALLSRRGLVTKIVSFVLHGTLGIDFNTFLVIFHE